MADRLRLLSWILPIGLALVFGTTAHAAEGVAQQHGIAMHGAPRLAPGFAHYPYVNPDAPKGGRIALGQQGTFDSLNPFIIKGTAPTALRDYVFDSLLSRGLDEPFGLYPQIARSIEVPADRSAITFFVDERARFSDGKPITVDDVLFSWEVLRDKGRPNFRAYYKKVQRTERVGERGIRFVFAPAEGAAGSAPKFDREMPLIMGLMPILPKHGFDAATFDRTTLEPLIGSGPYRIAQVDAGRSITFQRNPDYWARDLPVNRGRHNLDEIRIDFFRDGTTLIEAFRVGALDFRYEDDPARWAEAYNIPATEDGRIVKTEFQLGVPAGMTGLVFNTRRDVFKDQRVRAALIKLFDFAFVNKSLYHGLFKRTESYFERSYLASTGKAADARELAILGPYRERVRPDILDGTYRLATGDGTGRNRESWQEALRLLGEAGYRLTGGKLVDASGRQLRFEILAGSPIQERLLSSFANDLGRVGIAARVRIVDAAQYQARIKSYDYDMMQNTWPASLSPGNEQLFRWSAKAGAEPGSFNYAGVADPAVDAMIAAMLEASDADDFTASVRALDRVLRSGDYVVPLFHLPTQWVAHWRHLKHPERTPLFGFSLDTWWSEGARQ